MEGQTKDCDLSCDPADPRRSQVPGPESVKLATEDCVEAGDQASSSVYATGNTKKYVQQAFHQSMFLNRPRTPSVGNSSKTSGSTNPVPIQSVPKPQNGTPKELDSQNPAPPPWQKAPSPRTNKKRKISESPPQAEKTSTSNRFDILPLDSPDKLSGIPTHPKKPSKPPPIVLYGIQDVKELTKLMESVCNKNQFTLKILNKRLLHVLAATTDDYKKIITIIRENGLIGYTFTPKDKKSYRIVIKNLHHSTPHQAIIDAIEATGNQVTGEIINARYGPEKKPSSTFFVNLEQGNDNPIVKSITHIYNQRVKIEDPRKSKTIVQCQRCQEYGHSKNNCMRPFRCVKCGENHKTSECAKKDRSTPAKCALCSLDHPANYKGCQVYRELLARRLNNHNGNQKGYPNYKQPAFSHRKPIINAASISHAPASPEPAEREETSYQQKSYAQATRASQATDNQPKVKNSNSNQPALNLEKILTKQSEKIDLLIQQISSMLALITTLLQKISK